MAQSPLKTLATYIERKLHITGRSRRKGKKTIHFVLGKRQKFVLAVVVLSLSLFITGTQGGQLGVYVPFILAGFTVLFLWWAVRGDLKENFNWSVFILPFFYTLACSSFYFLVPARLLFRMPLTLLYAIGLYSLFLSQNVFIVGSIRTIALLSGARIVSFFITLVSYFFLSNIVLSFHLFIFPTMLIIALYTFPLIYQSLWTYILQKTNREVFLWVFGLTICLTEVVAALWFWPSSPTVMALFLTGFFYSIVGLSHVWFEKRLFRGVLWEYVWVSAVVFFVLVLFTTWGK